MIRKGDKNKKKGDRFSIKQVEPEGMIESILKFQRWRKSVGIKEREKFRVKVSTVFFRRITRERQEKLNFEEGRSRCFLYTQYVRIICKICYKKQSISTCHSCLQF